MSAAFHDSARLPPASFIWTERSHEPVSTPATSAAHAPLPRPRALDPPAALREAQRKYDALRDRLRTLPQVALHSPENALPYILNLSVQGIPSQVLINYLSARGIYVSAGSACKKGHRSEVLTAMGLPPAQIDSAIRVSMSRNTTDAELDAFAHALQTAIREIRPKL